MKLKIAKSIVVKVVEEEIQGVIISLARSNGLRRLGRDPKKIPLNQVLL